MQTPHRNIRPGAIHILPDCPPLHGEALKHRPVVVVGVSKSEPGIVIVAVSSQVRASVADRIRLPDRGSQPQTTSGLGRPSWAVPEWYMRVEASSLGEKIGYIGGATLRRLVNAVIARIEAGFPPVERRGRA